MPSLRSRRLRLLAAILLVIAAGVGVRYLPLGLPREVVKYAGSVLWGAMVYGLIALARPAAPVAPEGCMSGFESPRNPAPVASRRWALFLRARS